MGPVVIEDGLMKALRKPIRITVTQDSDGDPVTFSWRRGRKRVSDIRCQWIFSLNLGEQKKILREYFLIDTVRGTTCEIYRDPPTDWYLGEMWD